jgi:hypothetical protein
MRSETNSYDPLKILTAIIIVALFFRSFYLVFMGRFDTGLLMMGLCTALSWMSFFSRSLLSLAESFLIFAQTQKKIMERESIMNENEKIVALSLITINANIEIMNKNLETLVKHLNRLSEKSGLQFVYAPNQPVRQMDDLSLDELQKLMKEALEKEDYEKADIIKKVMEQRSK